MVKAVYLGLYSPIPILYLLIFFSNSVFELDCGMVKLNKKLNVLIQVSLPGL